MCPHLCRPLDRIEFNFCQPPEHSGSKCLESRKSIKLWAKPICFPRFACSGDCLLLLILCDVVFVFITTFYLSYLCSCCGGHSLLNVTLNIEMPNTVFHALPCFEPCAINACKVPMTHVCYMEAETGTLGIEYSILC